MAVTTETNLTMTLLTDALAMQSEVYDLDPIIQAARFGNTTQHIPRSTVWKAGSEHRKMYKEQYSGARVTSALEADAHMSTQLLVEDIEIAKSHFRRLGAPLQRTILTSDQVDGGDTSVFNIARELVLEAEEAIGEKRNFLLNSNGDCVKGYVNAVFDTDGTTYTDGSTSALLQVTRGSISSFKAGEYIHVRDASANAEDTDPQIKGQIEDVIYDEYFRGVNCGPAIIVSIKSDGPGIDATDANFDTVEDVATANAGTDEIASTGENDDNYPAAFGAVIDLSAAPSAYFGKTRTAVGNAYLLPMGRYWDSSSDGTGTAAGLDLDNHFGAMFHSYARMLSTSRRFRRNRKFKLTDAIVCQAPPELVGEIARQAGDATARFTREMTGQMDAARRLKLVAVAGWEGVVLHCPMTAFPSIAIQEEPLMDSNTVRFFEPSCMEFIRMGSRRPMYVPNASGGKWHNRRNATTGNLTMSVDAFCHVEETVFCDQPRLLYQIGGVTHSLTTT